MCTRVVLVRVIELAGRGQGVRRVLCRANLSREWPTPPTGPLRLHVGSRTWARSRSGPSHLQWSTSWVVSLSSSFRLRLGVGGNEGQREGGKINRRNISYWSEEELKKKESEMCDNIHTWLLGNPFCAGSWPRSQASVRLYLCLQSENVSKTICQII